MVYNNRFFKTLDEAKVFQKEHGGRLIEWPKRRCKRMHEFEVEMAVAWDARMEIVDPTVLSFCVAWNEKED